MKLNIYHMTFLRNLVKLPWVIEAKRSHYKVIEIQSSWRVGQCWIELPRLVCWSREMKARLRWLRLQQPKIEQEIRPKIQEMSFHTVTNHYKVITDHYKLSTDKLNRDLYKLIKDLHKLITAHCKLITGHYKLVTDLC